MGRIKRLRLWLVASKAADRELRMTGEVLSKEGSFEKDGKEQARFAKLVRFYELQQVLNAEPSVLEERSEELIYARMLLHVGLLIRQRDLLKQVDGQVVWAGGAYVRANYSARIEGLNMQLIWLAQTVKPFIDKQAGIVP